MTTETTTTEHRALPAIGKWRKASGIREGYQVLNGVKYDKDGTEEWWTVTRTMHITAPMKVSHLTFDNGTSGGVPSSDEFFSRTPAEAKRAEAKAQAAK